ncbi:sensor histidine kinase [Xylocopilactobacillus apicola]|uniref:histidine kinase n=1 Tax=Xylocopilactobacillus apicola TaxID=2932184 RepID=A0AAU9DPQ5_9LACO|nr:HAMP domain-containing sensor histidine kinase [Xylocopilactobacillus apicola]BDR57799.1 two-component sensor histidine kinase [Xylocopilactobacillus apicola]
MNNNKKIKLSRREVFELIAEGFITIGIMVLVSFALIIITIQFGGDGPFVQRSGSIFYRGMPVPSFGNDFWSFETFLYLFFGLFDISVVVWRLLRRYHLMEMRHVIAAMQEIADGHLEKRIDYQVNRELQGVVDSINALVDSAVHSMKEERRIEQSKDELITNVSHDLRTPLTSIIGYLNLIEDDQTLDLATIRKYVHIAFAKAGQMKYLTDDLFAYTKLNSQKVSYNYTVFNMNELIEQLSADFELEAEKSGLRIDSVVPANPITVELDSEKLGRALSNLVSNALKYAKKGTFIRIVLSDLGDQIAIRVENDGPKIPTTSLNKIFERFYRVDAARSGSSGSGLGLAIVQNIVEGLGGTVKVTSNRELTSFIIELPKNGRDVK